MTIEGLTIIGEKINYCAASTDRTSKGKLTVHGLLNQISQERVGARDFTPIQLIAQEQEAEGARYIDVNVDLGTVDDFNLSMMRDTVRAIQEAVDIPLCIDSASAELLRAGLEAYDSSKVGPAIVNSATLDRADAVLPLRKEHDFWVVLLMSYTPELTTSVNPTEDAFSGLSDLFHKARGYGFKADEIYFDPAMMPIAFYDGGYCFDSALNIMDHIGTTPDMKDAHTLVGISNFTRGIKRKDAKLPLQNAFLTLAVERGLDTVVGNTAANYRLLDKDNPYVEALDAILHAKGMEEKFRAYSARLTNLMTIQ